MSGKWWVFVVGLCLLSGTTALASKVEKTRSLRIYGPGGPHHVIKECAKLYQEKHGVEILVLPHDLKQPAREDGDIYYGGAEYMLTDFVSRNPDLLDLATMENLHPRRIGVLVRKGNPHLITGTADLHRDGIDLLDVQLENMRPFQGGSPGLRSNIRKFAYTGHQGVKAWRSALEIDAWVTYRSWHLLLKEGSDFIEIPGAAGVRFTPIALTRETLHRQESLKFISYLKSEEARLIFAEHGWY